MPFHWCYVESEALFILLGSIPLVGFYIKNLHARFHARLKTVCNKEKCCDKEHEEK